MKKVVLGNTGIEITRLGFGTLTMSPLQAGLPVETGAAVIEAALSAGVRFIDTAEMYGSLPQVALALRRWSPAHDARSAPLPHGCVPETPVSGSAKGPSAEPVVVASKSAAATAAAMERALNDALTVLGRPCIDIFLLHAVRDAADLERRAAALQVLLDAKAKGRVRAVGASSHSVQMVAQLAADARFDVLHPIVNRDGIGVLNGSLSDQLAALRAAKARGAGVYAMKPLAGGHLRYDVVGALAWAWARPEIDAVALGMASHDEVAMAVAVEAGKPVPAAMRAKVAAAPRRIFINTALCNGCGRCVDGCDHQAMTVVEGKARNTRDDCVICGYCLPRCPNFAIRMIVADAGPA